MQTKRNYLYLALSFFLPFFIMGIAFALFGIYPFGQWQIMIIDFKHQYYPFLSDLWHTLREGSSLLWSWTSGAGINYLSLIAYYMASPLNLLIVLFPHEWLREVLTVMILVKIGFAGMFFAMYLRYAFSRCDLSLPIFSMFYALCAFALGYYWNIMWLDTFALLPLVVLGIHAMVREGKWRLYVAALALSIFCNYYIGLFTCIFSAIIFFALCIIEKVSSPVLLRKLARIAICSSAAIGLTAVLTIPTFLSLQNAADPGNSFPTELSNLRRYIDILGNFIAFTPPTNFRGLPNVYCGAFTILLLGPFIRSERIPLRRKLTLLGITAFLIISCNLNVLNYIWHGFRTPVGMPFRFSFLVSFTMVLMAYHAYTSMDELNWRDLLAMAVAGTLFHVFAALGNQNPMLLGAESFGSPGGSDIAASAVLCAAYIILFALRFNIPSSAKLSKPLPFGITSGKPILNQKMFLSFVLALAIVEFILASHLGVITMGTQISDRQSYPEQYDNVRELLDMREPSGQGFYRTDGAVWKSQNDPALYGYDGVTVFSSTANNNAIDFMSELGLYGGHLETYYRYAYSQTTPVVDTFLNMRYLISYDGKTQEDGIYWERAASSGRTALYENKYYLPLGFMVQGELAGYAHVKNDPIHNQNELFRRATGLDGDLFTFIEMHSMEHRGISVTKLSSRAYTCTVPYGVTEGEAEWNFEVPDNGLLYLYVKIDRAVAMIDVEVLHGEEVLLSFITQNAPELYCLGYLEKDAVVTIVSKMDADLYATRVARPMEEGASGEAVVYAAQIDHEPFESGYKILSAETLELTEFTDTCVKGTITASKDGLLYTSIPYEKGWRAYVNGVEAEIIPIDGAMIAIPLIAGEYEIEFRYFSDGLLVGIIVTALSLLAVIVMAVFNKCTGKEKQNANKT